MLSNKILRVLLKFSHHAFQLREAILTGSISDGLLLTGIELPDFDYMCVLKNTMFSKEDQENGCSLVRDDTPFVYAYITNKETQHLWREFFDDVGVALTLFKKIKRKADKNYQKPGRTVFPSCDNEHLEEVTEGASLTACTSRASGSLAYYMQ
jgi:hypothetical protein